MPRYIDGLTRSLAELRRQPFANEYVLRIVRRPIASWRFFAIATRNLPPRMRNPHAGSEIFFPESKSLVEVSAQQRDIFRAAIVGTAQFYRDRQHRREAKNIVVPKCAANLRQIGFVEECPIARWLQIDSADLHIKGVFLRSHDQVRAVAAQLTINFV